MMMASPVLEMRHITKRFPGVLALDDVSFTCHRGQVHALVGENGAGKSTLIKVLAGALQPDAGEIVINGERVQFRDPHSAQLHGVNIIYQEFNLLPQLNVVENIFLGRERRGRGGLLARERMRREALALLKRVGLMVDPDTRVSRLSVSQQQLVEIAKALSQQASIVAMDEPSAVLAGHELEKLFELIRVLKQQGVTIIYISHRLDEVFQIADRVTVLKDGRDMGSSDVTAVSKPQLIRLMVGRTLDESLRPPTSSNHAVVLEVKNLTRQGALHDVSFKLHRGEIVGLAGMVGSGRSLVARALFGADLIDSGEILLEGQPLRLRAPHEAIRAGIALVPEDRKTQGLITKMSVRLNMTLPILNRLQRLGFVIQSRERTLVKDFTAQLSIKTPGLDQEVQYLSGGNQQKVVLAKWLAIRPRVVIMDEPTRGIDVGAKAEVYTIMRNLAEQGTAILMISSELPEIIGLSNRILVMRGGRIVGEVGREERMEEKIVSLAT
jgi:ABC-type sugar transport system ATPase subunit